MATNRPFDISRQEARWEKNSSQKSSKSDNQHKNDDRRDKRQEEKDERDKEGCQKSGRNGEGRDRNFVHGHDYYEDISHSKNSNHAPLYYQEVNSRERFTGKEEEEEGSEGYSQFEDKEE